MKKKNNEGENSLYNKEKKEDTESKTIVGKKKDNFIKFPTEDCPNSEFQFLNMVKNYNKLIENNNYQIYIFRIIENDEELNNRKLFLSLKRETIFAKDINEILASYEHPDSNDYRKTNDYIKKLKETIDDILNNPIEIESGYIQMITQIYNNHFNVEGNKNKQKIKSVKEKNNKFELFDKRCRLIIEDILKETPLNLKDIKYCNEPEFNSLSTETERLNEIAIKIMDPTINQCKKSLDNGECFYINTVLNKSTCETNEKDGNNEENIMDNKNKVVYVEHFDKVENKDKAELENNENTLVIPNDTINETLLQRNPSIITNFIPDLTISRYLGLFGYEESENDINIILESSILRNEKTKINLIIRYALMNDIILYIDENLLNNILINKDEMSQLFIDYATKYDIILNMNNDKAINYNISPNIILKFVKNTNYELEDIVFDNILENLDNITETFPDCPDENNRDLDKIANIDIRIPRNIKTYHEFKIQKIKIEEIIDDFDGKDKNLNFKIIENPEGNNSYTTGFF
ncbi:hypothetical protein PIROE2DRAFT_12682 [Piromyces sp. E2]|nr:hypothetical protein PIROE2DRAFT_12682 [Piromyces sp. E2]|eukprot:OUM61340.1 hypothetical protein PIROE2DRAFT_12682 [Piromyces sp. E2]